jgi:hypothetical protein
MFRIKEYMLLPLAVLLTAGRNGEATLPMPDQRQTFIFSLTPGFLFY